MKTKTALLLATTIAGGMLLLGCSNTAEDQAEEMGKKMEEVQDELNAASEAETRAAYERERGDALNKLYSFRDNIDRELVNVNERLETKGMSVEKRAEQEALRAELETQQDEVARLISSVESSPQGAWISLKEEIREASDAVGTWWDRTKDNVDEMTDADKDMDGK